MLFADVKTHCIVELELETGLVSEAVMSLASWYDSIPFHFCILVFLLRR